MQGEKIRVIFNIFDILCFKNYTFFRVWWLILAILMLKGMRQEDYGKLEVGQGYKVKPCLKKLIFIFYTSFFCLLKSELSFRSDLLHGEFEREDTQVSYLQFATTWLSYFVVVCQLDMS